MKYLKLFEGREPNKPKNKKGFKDFFATTSQRDEDLTNGQLRKYIGRKDVLDKLFSVLKEELHFDIRDPHFLDAPILNVYGVEEGEYDPIWAIDGWFFGEGAAGPRFEEGDDDDLDSTIDKPYGIQNFEEFLDYTSKSVLPSKKLMNGMEICTASRGLQNQMWEYIKDIVMKEMKKVMQRILDYEPTLYKEWAELFNKFGISREREKTVGMWDFKTKEIE